MSSEGGGAGAGPIHPRLLAMMTAARYYGLELDPAEFRLGPGRNGPYGRGAVQMGAERQHVVAGAAAANGSICSP